MSRFFSTPAIEDDLDGGSIDIAVGYDPVPPEDITQILIDPETINFEDSIGFTGIGGEIPKEPYQSIPTDPTHKFNYVDIDSYTTKRVSSPFKSVYGITGGTIFTENRHYTLDKILSNDRSSYTDFLAALYDISPDTLKLSVKPEIREILYNLRYIDGRKISDSQVFKWLIAEIRNGTVDDIDVGYLQQLDVKRKELFSPNIEPISKAKYGTKVSELIKNRDITVEGNSFNQHDYPVANRARGVYKALRYKKSIDPNQHKNENTQALRLWYILPTDINCTVIVYNEVDTISNAGLVSDEFKFTIIDETLTEQELDINLDYTVTVIDENEVAHRVPIFTDRERAYILPNKRDVEILFEVGSEDATVLKVTSLEEEDVEINLDIEDELPNYFLFILDNSTLEDVSDFNSYTRKTKAEYTYITDLQEANQAIKFSPYPWKIFYVDHNDPILKHIGLESTHEFIFTDFTLQEFGDDSSEPIFVRKIPRVIAVIPTDKTRYKLLGGQSVLEDWNIRTIKFKHSLDPRDNNLGLFKHYLTIQNTYPSVDISDNAENLEALQYIFEEDSNDVTDAYKEGSEPLPRKTPPMKAINDMIVSLRDNYDYNEGLTWLDVLSRLDSIALMNFGQDAIPNMLSAVRRGDKTNVRLFYNRSDPFNQQRTNRSRLRNLKESGAQVDSIDSIPGSGGIGGH